MSASSTTTRRRRPAPEPELPEPLPPAPAGPVRESAPPQVTRRAPVLPAAYPGCPEALGPAVETAAGAVQFGVPGPVTGPVPPPRDRAEKPAPIEPCIRCSEVPDDLLAALSAALRQRGAAATWPCPRCGALPEGIMTALDRALADARSPR